MLAAKELLNLFKAAPWTRPDELEAFLAQAEVPATAELLKLVDALTAKADPRTAQLRMAAFSRLVERNPDKALFVPLVKAMRAAEQPVRSSIAAVLPKVNSLTEHEGLVAHLRDRDQGLRQAAAQALIAIGGSKTAFDLLTQACAARDFAGRVEAMQVLVSFAKHLAVPALQAVLAVGAPAEKMQALRHLGDPRAMGNHPASALKVLATALVGPEPLVAQAIGSFSALATEEEWFKSLDAFLDVQELPLVRAAVAGLRRFPTTRSVAALRRKLRAGPLQIRLTVVTTLEAIASDVVLPALVEALGHRQAPVRARGAEVLQRLTLEGKVDVARTILWLLRSPEPTVRRTAAELIRLVPDPAQTLWQRVVGLLREESFWVREQVLEGIVELAGPHLAPYLMVLLGDPSEVIRRFAVNALGRLKDARALRALLQAAASDPDWWVREAAVEAVARVNDGRAIPHLVKLMLQDPELQIVCLQALADMQARAVAPSVAAMLDLQDADVRVLALGFMSRVDAREQSEAIGALSEDPDPRVRAAVRELLGRWQVRVESAFAEVPLLDRLLIRIVEEEADDLLLAPGRPAYMKKVGRTTPITSEPLTAEQVEAMLAPHLSAEQIVSLQAAQDVDYSHEVRGESLRFRANVFRELNGLSGVFRRIKGQLPDIDSLGVPPLVKQFGDLKNGLVLVGGPTGSGKSTTLAALIDLINRTSARHIISLEDPIEVQHPRKKSLVNQREIGTHSKSFARALRSTLRADPNVILVGEMRDLATLEFTVMAAETGHLVFGTVHTASAATTIDRMVSAFAPGQQAQVRSTLADSLRAVVCQHLLREKSGQGRVLALEILLNNDAVGNLIRKGKSYQLPSVIATSTEQGMRLMDNDLMRLLKENRISAEDAYLRATSKKEFEAYLAARPEGAR